MCPSSHRLVRSLRGRNLTPTQHPPTPKVGIQLLTRKVVGAPRPHAPSHQQLRVPASSRWSRVAESEPDISDVECSMTQLAATQCNALATPTAWYTPTPSELSSQGVPSYTPYSISAGCDFLCVLTSAGQLGVYTHSSGQLFNYHVPEHLAGRTLNLVGWD